MGKLTGFSKDIRLSWLEPLQPTDRTIQTSPGTLVKTMLRLDGETVCKIRWLRCAPGTKVFSAESTTDMETHRTEAEQFERIRTGVFQTSDEAVGVVAASIARLIRQRQQEARTAVLGLATGSTPVKLYRELIRLHRNEGLSFRNVVTFNLDEYYGLPPHHPESYRRFMEVQLFSHVDVPRENV